MTVSFTAGNNAVSAAPLDLITSAMLEAGIIAAGEPVDDAQWGLEKLQRLIDQFNAQREIIYSHTFSLFNLIANHAPHTIGPGGDFNVAIRPVKVISASFILNGGSSNPVDTPVVIRDDQWWAANPLKSLTSSVVTDLYYDSAVPLGNLNFYPICNAVFPVRLEMWNSLPQAIDFTTQISFPQGYWDAIVLTLALSLCPSYERNPHPVLVAAQQQAMKVIMANNDKAPRIDTDISIAQPGRAGRPDFNFLTGLRE